MRSKHRLAAGLMGVLLFLLNGCALLPKEEELPQAPVRTAEEQTEYRYAYVQRGDLVDLQYFDAEYRAIWQERLAFDVDGLRFESILVSAGETVEEGQILAQLDVQAVREQLTQKKNELERLELELTQAKENHAQSWAEYDQTLQKLSETERAKAESIEEKLLPQTRALEKMEDRVEVARLEKKTLEDQLNQLSLRAPFSGTVTYIKTLENGQRSKRGEVVATVSDLESAIFVVKPEQKYFSEFTEGRQIEIRMSSGSYPCRVLGAQDAGIAPEEAQGMIFLGLLEPAPELMNGEHGGFELILEERQDVLYLPSDCIITMAGETFVYLENEQGLRSLHPVQVGFNADKRAEIVSGLNEGDPVILGNEG